jgi:hypothetical protein
MVDMLQEVMIQGINFVDYLLFMCIITMFYCLRFSLSFHEWTFCSCLCFFFPFYCWKALIHFILQFHGCGNKAYENVGLLLKFAPV